MTIRNTNQVVDPKKWEKAWKLLEKGKRKKVEAKKKKKV